MARKLAERYRIGLELLGHTDGLEVLDAGCGFGTISQYADVVSIDKSLYNLRQFSETDLHARRLAGCLENLPFPDEQFDAVMMLEVLEHVKDEDACLEEINRVSKKAAKLILSVPNDRFLYNIMDLETWLIPILTHRQRHRHYKKEALAQMLEKHGFKIEIVFERGFIFSVLIGRFVFCFDMIDRVFFGGFNGPCGRLVRKVMDPLVDLDFRLPTHYGHTIFITASKA